MPSGRKLQLSGGFTFIWWDYKEEEPQALHSCFDSSVLVHLQPGGGGGNEVILLHPHHKLAPGGEGGGWRRQPVDLQDSEDFLLLMVRVYMSNSLADRTAGAGGCR